MADSTTTPSDNPANTPNLEYDQQAQDALEKIGRTLYNTSGYNQFTSFQDALFGFDTIRNTLYMPERESHGFTFITRPKLNLSSPSLRSDRILSMLDTLDPGTVAFAIRALLDSSIIRRYNVATSNGQYFDKQNPFIPILSNRLLQLNGWPDPMLDIETTEGGFFSESITYPKGWDQLSRNYDITATFSDMQGSVIYNLFSMWLRWIQLSTRGHVTAYTEDIEARRMCFTSSIYRFVMDPSNRYITKWAKATGCYPRSVPSGAFFNYDVNGGNIDVAMNLSVPMTVSGKIEYNDPIIFREFNMLVDKYANTDSAYTDISSFVETSRNDSNAMDKNVSQKYNDFRQGLNFKCTPYIDTKSGSNELLWRYDTRTTDITSIKQAFGYPQ